VKNLREIFTFDADAQFAKLPDLFKSKEAGEEPNPFQMVDMFKTFCEQSYDLPEVMALLDEKFDLVMVESVFNECAFGLIHKLNTSLVIVSPLVVPSWTSAALGGFSPPSFVPNIFSGFTDRMTFYQRLLNFASEVLVKVLRKFYFNPAMAEIYRNKLNDSTIPLPDEILKNASLVISNSHVSIGSPQLLLPDVVEVGGMHMRSKLEKLPKDLEDFVNSSGNDGFILFSMGSALKGSTMPEKKRKMILGAFSKLKQKVLWKWETETMPDLPPNVKLSKWLPQQDVLGHPKIKAFITHGGFGSTTEAVYHGVPLVGIPMFGDQELNMQRSESSGFAVTLQYNDFTEQDLLDAINKVVTKPEYKENVMKLSSIFRDQPDKALDRAVFWVEYVLRHQGAVHLRSAARDLNFFQYHSLDVLGLIFGVLGLVLYIIFATIRFIFRKLCGGGKKPKATDSKKKKN